MTAVEDYLGKGFTYSETPPAGSRTLDGFLFDTKQGFCQQFSGAEALLLRMGGIPARVSTGFTSGAFDNKAKEWVVRDLDAHSWVEVWFPGYGWVTRDPTPAASPSRRSGAPFVSRSGGVVAGRPPVVAARRGRPAQRPRADGRRHAVGEDRDRRAAGRRGRLARCAATCAAGRRSSARRCHDLQRALRRAGLRRRAGHDAGGARAPVPAHAGGRRLRARRCARSATATWPRGPPAPSAAACATRSPAAPGRAAGCARGGRFRRARASSHPAPEGVPPGLHSGPGYVGRVRAVPEGVEAARGGALQRRRRSPWPRRATSSPTRPRSARRSGARTSARTSSSARARSSRPSWSARRPTTTRCSASAARYAARPPRRGPPAARAGRVAAPRSARLPHLPRPGAGRGGVVGPQPRCYKDSTAFAAAGRCFGKRASPAFFMRWR